MAATNPKKRSAKSQPGPATKKSKAQNISTSEKSTKRSRPITSTIQNKDDNDSDDDVDFEVEEVELEGDDDADAEEMEIDDSPNVGIPGAARESHKVQKAMQKERKAAKSHSTLLTEAKHIWALARSTTISSAQRQKHVGELMGVIRGKVKEIVFKHDASRIVQTLVKYGGAKERNEIAQELKGGYKDLAKNKYSKFLVTKLIRFCPTHRASILLEFQGQVMKMLLHREASSVLADAFELYANAYEKSILLREFYGKEVALFSTSSLQQTDAEKEYSKKGLVGVLEGFDKERTKRVLGALKENLDSIFNNPDKGAIQHAIVHRAAWEYLTALNTTQDAGEAEKMRRDLFENCQEILADMVHTKDGSRVVREFLARGSAKDRKQILKTLKPHIERMCLDEEAQMVLFTAMDVVDDTKLLQKSLTSAITTPSTLATLLSSGTPQGRRAILYLIVPRTRRHFTPAMIEELRECDRARDGLSGKAQTGLDAEVNSEAPAAGATGGTSKKSAETRMEEVRKGASESLIQWVTDKGAEMVRDPGGSLVVAEIMLSADGDKSAATTTLLRALTEPYPSQSSPSSPSTSAIPTTTSPTFKIHPPKTQSPTTHDTHPIDLPHTSRLYKTLLQGGHFNHTTKTVEPSLAWDAGVFAVRLIDVVGGAGEGEGDLIKAICLKGQRNGTFLVAELCAALTKSGDEDKTEGTSEAREKLKSWLCTPSVQKAIEEGEAKGKKVLLESLEKL